MAVLGLCLTGVVGFAAPAGANPPPPPLPLNSYYPTISSNVWSTPVAATAVGSDYWVNAGYGFYRQRVGQTSNEGLVGFSGQAVSLAVSADHTTAYVALPADGKVDVIVAATPAVTASIDVGCNPRSLAISGSKLLYGWGCSGSGGVGVIDLTTGTAGSTTVLPTPTVGSPMIAVTADRMLVADTDGTVLSYAFDGATASGTPATLTANGTPVSIAVSPDGASFAVATTSTVAHTYDATTLAPVLDFHLKAKPVEVAFSPDSTRLAITTSLTGLTVYAPPMYVFDATTGASLVRGILAVKGHRMLPIGHTISFTADSKLMHFFASSRLVTSTAVAPKHVKLTLALTPSKRAGGTNRLTVSSGVPGLTITMEYIDWANYPSRRTHKTDSNGKVTFTFRDYGGGTVSASTPGDLSHASTRTAPRHYRVDSSVKVSLVGKHSTSKGVYRFQDENHFYANVSTTPTAEAMVVTEAKHGSKWVVEDRLRISTFQINPRVILVRDMKANQLYRFKISTIASTYIRSSTTTSPTFTFSH